MREESTQLVEFHPSAISTWGAAVVFLNVLITRLGVPIPAVPVLLLAGTAVANGHLSFWHVLTAALAGALIGDGVWFAAGRMLGRRVIHALARLSAAVEAHMRKARVLFMRFGLAIVSVSKFVPGLAIITPPLMGTTRVGITLFFAWDALGIVAWATFWLLGGAIFERQLNMLLHEIRAHGWTIIDMLAVIAACYLAFRFVQRWRLQRPLSFAPVSPEQLDAMMRADKPPLVLDARPDEVKRQAPQRIPGALPLDIHSPGTVDAALLARDVVVYCVCADDVTAKTLSQQMRDKGFTRVRALRGGLDAWERRGYTVEPSTGSDYAAAPRTREKRRTLPDKRAITLRGIAPRGAVSS
ncbi:DedA family protein/thiosulfate sulfurtransferase GlpE [Paraburkholderia sp. LEh10]|uniref:DedA family protein/thiosulfate sulfurtransferase GlpE n=1 Tax=Paraburkholderia sp. LEh10 TaxID=2821353 RepID=UPI001AE8C61E|nr:DedA family protein/thiosulfate sulfurtransferase GlpE [Paraburkholderia sp. LEh10]MBP0592021.1 DedA family protein/thiosulfate sulfurtransferase GlpE [Paraburkholderia sp. LEh10]